MWMVTLELNRNLGRRNRDETFLLMVFMYSAFWYVCICIGVCVYVQTYLDLSFVCFHLTWLPMRPVNLWSLFMHYWLNAKEPCCHGNVEAVGRCDTCETHLFRLMTRGATGLSCIYTTGTQISSDPQLSMLLGLSIKSKMHYLQLKVWKTYNWLVNVSQSCNSANDIIHKFILFFLKLI